MSFVTREDVYRVHIQVLEDDVRNLQTRVADLERHILALNAKVERVGDAHEKLRLTVKQVIDILKEMSVRVKYKWFP